MMVKAIHEFLYNLHEKGVLKRDESQPFETYIRCMSIGWLIELIKDYPGDWLTAMAAVRVRGVDNESE